MSGNEREEINSRLNIVDIAGKYLTLKRAGTRYLGLCPFHNEKTPSFTVTPEKNLFYCYGCHKGGTIFDFIMEIENMSFPEALRHLADIAGVELKGGMSPDSPDRKKADAMKELYKRAAGSFHYILKNREEAETARIYLAERGVSPEMFEEFQLGWAPEDRGWLLGFLRSKGYSDQFLEESGLFSKRGLGYPLFSGRIMFPVISRSGDVTAFSGRTLKDFGPKYINSPETILFHKKKSLYGLSSSIKGIRERGYAILCEGQMDVIAYHQDGLSCAVAPLGTAFTPEQAGIIKRYTDKLVISFDGDNAGRKAAEKAVILCEQKDITTKIALMPEKSDPADILLNNGQKALHKVMKSTINSFDYILENAIGVSGISTPEGKEEVIHNLRDYLASLTSEVRRNSCINEIAERLSVEYRSVLLDYNKGGYSHGTAKRPEASAEKKEEVSIELFLMIAVVVNRDFFSYVRSRIGIDDLLDVRARSLYIALEECFRNEETELDSVFKRLSDKSLAAIIAEKVTSEEYCINSQELIRDTVKKIKRRSLIERRDEIVKKLRDISKNNVDDLNETELLSEKIFIDQELEKLRLGI
jgi:DNA primase